ncbi:hypothetical protein PAPHI01_1600 [Pancytospora philotis]|nr:hypothetical protein PAPHI01_1600 [Pancytospora philotis]
MSNALNMQVLSILACICIFFASLLTVASVPGVVKRGTLHRDPFFRTRNAYAVRRYDNALPDEEKLRQDALINNMLYQCYFEGQPTIAHADRSRGAEAILQRACAVDSYERSQRMKERKQCGQKGARARTRKRVVVRNSRRSELKSSRALYRIMDNAIPATTAHAGNAGQAGEEDTQPAARAASGELDAHGNLAAIYGILADTQSWARADSESVKTPSLFRYYFEDAQFARFLAARTSDAANSAFYVSEADLNVLKDAARSGTPYSALDEPARLLFAKLVFNRNTFQTYISMAAIAETFQLVVDECRTVDMFMHAMHSYLMDMHAMREDAVVPAAVTASLLAADMFALAYVQCSPLTTYISVGHENHRVVQLRRHIADRAHLYIESMIMLYQAWEETPDGTVCPDILDDVMARIRAFRQQYEHRYDEGCT